MNKVLAIALITIKEEVRNRVVYLLLMIAFFLLFLARGCASGKITMKKGILLSPEQLMTAGIIVTFNMILLWGLSLCGLLAMNTLSRELTEETIVLTVTKPIKRSYVLVGKFLGIFSMVFLNLMLVSIGFFLLLYFRSGVVKPSIFSGLLVASLNFISIISFIFLFSLCLPRVISGLLSLTIYILSLGLGIIFSFEKIRAYWEPSFSTQVLYYVLPQLGRVHLYACSFLSSIFPSSKGWWPVVDVVGYSFVVWLVMICIFQKKSL